MSIAAPRFMCCRTWTAKPRRARRKPRCGSLPPGLATGGWRTWRRAVAPAARPGSRLLWETGFPARHEGAWTPKVSRGFQTWRRSRTGCGAGSGKSLPVWRRAARRRAAAPCAASPRTQFGSIRMVLEEPGFGQGLVARLQKGAQLDRVASLDDEVELGPPVASDAVGHRLDQLIGPEGSARGRDDEVGLDAKGQVRERAAQEFDHELAHPFRPRLAGLAAAAEPCRHCDAEVRRNGGIGEPVEPVVEVQLGPCEHRLGRDPHRHDIIVDLVVGGDLAELY